MRHCSVLDLELILYSWTPCSSFPFREACCFLWTKEQVHSVTSADELKFLSPNFPLKTSSCEDSDCHLISAVNTNYNVTKAKSKNQQRSIVETFRSLVENCFLPCDTPFLRNKEAIFLHVRGLFRNISEPLWKGWVEGKWAALNPLCQAYKHLWSPLHTPEGNSINIPLCLSI